VIVVFIVAAGAVCLLVREWETVERERTRAERAERERDEMLDTLPVYQATAVEVPLECATYGRRENARLN
jgi:hypothetical protein